MNGYQTLVSVKHPIPKGKKVEKPDRHKDRILHG